MSVRSGQAIVALFTTRSFSTGAITAATGTPTGTLYVNGASNAASVTVTSIATGIYTAAVTLPTLAVNDLVQILITATVSGVTDTAAIWGDTKDFFAGSVPDVIAGGSGGLFIAGTNAATTVTTSFTTTFTGNLTGSVGSVATGVTVTTNSDKTGYSLSVTPPTAAQIATGVWQDTTAGDFTVSSSIGKSLYTTGNAPGAASGLLIAGSNAATTFATGSHLIGTVDTVTTVTNQLTAAAIATGIWQDTTAGDFTVVSSIGKSLFTSGNVPGAASGLALVGSNMGTITGGTVTTLTNLPAIPNNWLTATGIAAAALNGKGDWLLSSSYTVPPATGAIATAVWTDLMASSDFSTVSSIGALLKADINAPIGSIPTNPYTGTPPTVSQIWTTALTEAYAANGAAFTAAQGLFMVWSLLSEFAISGTSYTSKKLDGSTTSMIFTLDSGTSPTSLSRSS